MKKNEMRKQRQGRFLISKIHHLSGRIFSKLLKRYGIEEINPAQGKILFVLWRNDGIAINELVKETSLSKSSLTSMLDRLENARFIERVPSREDRRKIHIYSTRKDKSLQKKYVEISEEMTEIYYGGFSDNERAAFETYLERIFENLKHAW